MVAINPGFVIGPLLQPTLNFTVEVFLNHITGATFPNERYGCKRVRDVAFAHIQAFQIPSASGRYCLVGKVAHFSEVLEILHEYYPTLLLPERYEDDKPFPSSYGVSGVFFPLLT